MPTDHIENGFNLGRWVAVKRLAATNPKSKHRLTQENKRKLESYPGWYWDGMEGRWERGKQLLLNFVAKKGHSRVTHSHMEDGFELGKWVGMWRYQYNKNTLPQWKIDFFESLPQWSWDFNLGEWVQTQRKAFKAGKITKERIDLLQKLTGWSWDTRHETVILNR